MSKDQWFAMMFSAFAKWVKQQNGAFKTEDFRAEMIAKDYPMPIHHNHWGALTQLAQNAGIIKKAGFDVGRAPGQHGNIVRSWQRA